MDGIDDKLDQEIKDRVTETEAELDPVRQYMSTL